MLRVALASFLLLCTNAQNANAEEVQELSKNSKKIIIIMNSVGLNNKDLHQLVHYVDSRVDDGYFNITEEQVVGGKISLQYELGTKIGTEQFQLKYAPENSNFEYTARTNAVMVNYNLKF